MPLSLGNAVALFLTAWLIYLADRLVDASSLKNGTTRSLRQEFCLRHREFWMGALLIIGGLDAFVIWRSTAAVTFFVGAVVGVIALMYLVLNQPLGLIWRSLPAKEIAIGLLFAAGTLVALLPAFPPRSFAFVAGAVAFAGLCALNCVAIACWERNLDEAQRKVSIATRHPKLDRNVGKICAALALASLLAGLVWRDPGPVFGCVAASALFLALLDGSQETKEGRLPNRPQRLVSLPGIGRDKRVALADLVLLTPLILLILTSL